MIDPYLARRLLYMLLFLGISALILFTRMLPLHNGAQNFPPPDLILCFAFAWTVRRPDYLPVLLVAAILLVGDMLSLAPPGIAPLLAILGLEALRSRRGLLAEQGFALEWVSVGAILTLMMLAERLILGFVLFAPNTTYPQHSHKEIEESYISLAGAWSENDAAVYAPGSLILNRSEHEHRITTGQVDPCLLAYAWIGPPDMLNTPGMKLTAPRRARRAAGI